MKKVTFLNHASILIQSGDNIIMTDPWYKKPAFGSWLSVPPCVYHPSYFMALAKSNPNFVILISHGHDDHFDDDFLTVLPKNTTILFPKYKSPGPKKRLKKCGIKNIIEFDSKGVTHKGVTYKSYIFEDISMDDAFITVATDKFIVAHGNDNWQKLPQDVFDSVFLDFAKYKKEKIAELYSELFFTKKAKLNCIQKPNRYLFSEPELTFEGSDLTYVITYKPKGGEDFEGTLYINAEDFAVTRLDFNNVKPLIKLKLLGVSYNENLKSGRMIFSKNANNKYALSYLQMTSGSEIGVDRPLKFIEKNKFVKGRRKQNEISFRLDLAMVSKDHYELRVFDHESLTEEAFQAIEEKNDVLPKYHKEFTTNFWEEF